MTSESLRMPNVPFPTYFVLFFSPNTTFYCLWHPRLWRLVLLKLLVSWTHRVSGYTFAAVWLTRCQILTCHVCAQLKVSSVFFLYIFLSFLGGYYYYFFSWASFRDLVVFLFCFLGWYHFSSCFSWLIFALLSLSGYTGGCNLNLVSRWRYGCAFSIWIVWTF